MLENNDMKFDPFENRACRDTRNHLGHEMVAAIQNRSLTGISNFSTAATPDDNQPHILDYIAHRKACIKQILEQINAFITASGPDRSLGSSALTCVARECSGELDHLICTLLWNHGLFFEFHEWLEQQWVRQTGNTKKGLQALILAAVAFEHLEYNRITPARTLARKAARFIQQYAGYLPEWVDPSLWIKQLSASDIKPFKLDILFYSNKQGAS